MPIRQISTVTLPRALFGLVLAGIVIFAVTAAVLVRDRVRDFQDVVMDEAVRIRTGTVGLAFARALDQDWQHLQAIAGDMAGLEVDRLRAVLNAAAGVEERISWAGFAAPDGEVIAASDGLLEGADVSERPWFRRGLQGPFAGDVHDALLLAAEVPAGAGGPARFLDMAAPVVDAVGRPRGVLGFHINASWAEAFLVEVARTAEMDLMLVNPVGEVVVTTVADAPEVLDLPSLRAATAGVAVSGRETWPDGVDYFTTVLPQVTHGDLPSFGWRLVGRIQPASFPITPGAELVWIAALAVLVAGLFYGFLAFVFSQYYLRPFAQLADTADRMAEGHEEYPKELRAPAEAQRLSAALARLDPRGS